MEDFDRIPAAKGEQTLPEHLVVPAPNADVAGSPVRGLEMRGERVRMKGRRAQPSRHPLGEEAVVIRSGNEVPPRTPDDAEPLGNRREELAEAASARAPELVRIRVEDPVGGELGGCQPGHVRDPLGLTKVVALLANEVQMPIAGIALENLRGAVLRTVVSRDDEIDAGVQVKRDLGIDDVHLVSSEEGHDELHRSRRLDPSCATTAGTAIRSSLQASRAAPRIPPQPEQRKLRCVLLDRAQLHDPIAHGRSCRSERRASLSECVRLLGVSTQAVGR